MMVDRHGLTIRGLKKASGNTFDYGYYNPRYVEVFYDTKSCRVWTVEQYSAGRNSFTVYNAPEIVKVCETSRHLGMQDIADLIERKLDGLRVLTE